MSTTVAIATFNFASLDVNVSFHRLLRRQPAVSGKDATRPASLHLGNGIDGAERLKKADEADRRRKRRRKDVLVQIDLVVATRKETFVEKRKCDVITGGVDDGVDVDDDARVVELDVAFVNRTNVRLDDDGTGRYATEQLVAHRRMTRGEVVIGFETEYVRRVRSSKAPLGEKTSYSIGNVLDDATIANHVEGNAVGAEFGNDPSATSRAQINLKR